MFNLKSATTMLQRLGCATLLCLTGLTAVQSAEMSIRDVPLFLNDTPPPLNMLVLSRDHRLYYEAYNDSSDLNDDGVLDVGYKPTQIDYFGYFESHLCYTYSGGIFSPAGATGANKTCSGQWSGDWLNYVTTSRMDALRKVLYGGMRYIDSATDTVLQRAYVPQDAHSWGKEYESVARDGYDISQYTPFALPITGRHLFANTTLLGDTAESLNPNAAINGVAAPKLRVLQNSTVRIWNWVSIERPVAGGQVVTGLSAGGSEIRANVTPNDYIVRVRVCSPGYVAGNPNCKVYANGNAKPTGLLQDYGESNSMYFGLLTGSYGKPHDGGVLRKGVASVAGEINSSTGQFIYNQNPPGIISTIDRLRVTGFGGNYEYSCGLIATSADAAGNCSMWGNPTAEMMYETLRYFAGKTGPTSTFHTGANNSQETGIGLSIPTWSSSTNPFRSGGYPACSKPFQTVISDISPSYDSETIPGSYFGGYSGDLAGLNASTLGDTIWNNEIGASGKYFIGQSASSYDGAPTVKTVTSFGNIRGLAPEAPAKEGSYNAASVAYHGHQTDLSTAAGQQKLQTFSVALASPLPKIEIDVGGRKVTLVPFAKSVGGGYGINAAQGSYQPTNQIVDFYVDTITSTYGKFRVNFEDVEQGSDHDMDAIVIYEYTVNADNTVTVRVTSEYAAGGITQHLGYVISGTTADGTYLEVRDTDTSDAANVRYFLDTADGAPSPNPNWNTDAKLGLVNTRSFSPSGSPAAGYLKDPLWYAAKWGGFNDTNSNNRPDLRSEWANDAAAGDSDPDPDNYFLVTNALRLKEQLSQAFNSILDRAGSASSASVSSGSISDDTRIYQATFDSRNWAGHLVAYPVGTGQSGTTEGALGTAVWDAAEEMPAPGSRKILTMLPPASATAADGIIPASRAVAFRWADIGTTRQGQLAPTADGRGEARLNFLRGDRANEAPSGIFRRRTSILGDIVNSAPVFVGPPAWRYSDSLEPSVPYSGFVTAQTNRQKVVYAGANDGMMHAFDATTGEELFSYVPHAVFKNLHRLTDQTYSHRFYVDGTPSVVDAFFGSAWHTVLVAGLNKGGQSVYALDVTNPASVTESAATSTVMWEFTDQADADLGYTYSRPAVVKLQNGQWVAIFGNGYDNTSTANGDTRVSTTGNAVLYVVDIATGALLRKLDTGRGMTVDPLALSRPNGLSTPAVIDKNGDGRSDTVYAGDLFGNMWKFDLSGAAAADWNIAYSGNPLFVATNASNQRQPITVRPQIGRGPAGQGWLVLFGTGKFLESDDRNLATLRVQGFYGIFDRATGAATDIVPRADLLQQTVVAESTLSWTDAQGDHSVPVRVTSNNALNATHRGWYINLVAPAGFQGEMQVTNPVLRNGRVIFTTLIPDSDICAYGGRSWLMDMDALSGSRLTYTPFDLNRDGEYDDNDFIEVDGVKIPATGRGVDAILTAPAFLSGNISDYAVTTSSGSNTDDSTIGIERSNAGPAGRGRQSWRQLR